MLVSLPYNREHAVEYARRWALSRNPLFPDFAGVGGDCTNFVSQAVLAGSCVVNPTRDFGWYYRSPTDRAPAWSGVRYFYEFLTGAPDFIAENGGVGPYGSVVTTDRMELGDIIQLANAEGVYYHTLVVTGRDGDDFLISAHTNDALDRPLSTYRYATARYLHIEGVRIAVDNERCFPALLAGEGLDLLCCGGCAFPVEDLS